MQCISSAYQPHINYKPTTYQLHTSYMPASDLLRICCTKLPSIEVQLHDDVVSALEPRALIEHCVTARKYRKLITLKNHVSLKPQRKRLVMVSNNPRKSWKLATTQAIQRLCARTGSNRFTMKQLRDAELATTVMEVQARGNTEHSLRRVLTRQLVPEGFLGTDGHGVYWRTISTSSP